MPCCHFLETDPFGSLGLLLTTFLLGRLRAMNPMIGSHNQQQIGQKDRVHFYSGKNFDRPLQHRASWKCYSKGKHHASIERRLDFKCEESATAVTGSATKGFKTRTQQCEIIVCKVIVSAVMLLKANTQKGCSPNF